LVMSEGALSLNFLSTLPVQPLKAFFIAMKVSSAKEISADATRPWPGSLKPGADLLCKIIYPTHLLNQAFQKSWPSPLQVWSLESKALKVTDSAVQVEV